MLPPFPPVADPVDTAIMPLEPELEVPVPKRRLPLTPFVPALDVFIDTLPLLELEPTPVDTLTLPPVTPVLIPLLTNIFPPSTSATPL
jgi:hypothetical protein